jgi:hypothetical protein
MKSIHATCTHVTALGGTVNHTHTCLAMHQPRPQTQLYVILHESTTHCTRPQLRSSSGARPPWMHASQKLNHLHLCTAVLLDCSMHVCTTSRTAHRPHFTCWPAHSQSRMRKSTLAGTKTGCLAGWLVSSGTVCISPTAATIRTQSQRRACLPTPLVDTARCVLLPQCSVRCLACVGRYSRFTHAYFGPLLIA